MFNDYRLIINKFKITPLQDTTPNKSHRAISPSPISGEMSDSGESESIRAEQSPNRQLTGNEKAIDHSRLFYPNSGFQRTGIAEPATTASMHQQLSDTYQGSSERREAFEPVIGPNCGTIVDIKQVAMPNFALTNKSNVSRSCPETNKAQSQRQVALLIAYQIPAGNETRNQPSKRQALPNLSAPISFTKTPERNTQSQNKPPTLPEQISSQQVSHSKIIPPQQHPQHPSQTHLSEYDLDFLQRREYQKSVTPGQKHPVPGQNEQLPSPPLIQSSNCLQCHQTQTLPPSSDSHQQHSFANKLWPSPSKQPQRNKKSLFGKLIDNHHHSNDKLLLPVDCRSSDDVDGFTLFNSIEESGPNKEGAVEVQDTEDKEILLFLMLLLFCLVAFYMKI